MMIKSNKVVFLNSLHPGYGECSKCGGNWGWKKYATHSTSKTSGLFLFCEDCNKIVTLEERWKALDEWKRQCVSFLYKQGYYGKELESRIKEIDDTEFIEYPKITKG